MVLLARCQRADHHMGTAHPCAPHVPGRPATPRGALHACIEAGPGAGPDGSDRAWSSGRLADLRQPLILAVVAALGVRRLYLLARHSTAAKPPLPAPSHPPQPQPRRFEFVYVQDNGAVRYGYAVAQPRRPTAWRLTIIQHLPRWYRNSKSIQARKRFQKYRRKQPGRGLLNSK